MFPPDINPPLIEDVLVLADVPSSPLSSKTKNFLLKLPHFQFLAIGAPLGWLHIHEVNQVKLVHVQENHQPHARGLVDSGSYHHHVNLQERCHGLGYQRYGERCQACCRLQLVWLPCLGGCT